MGTEKITFDETKKEEVSLETCGTRDRAKTKHEEDLSRMFGTK